MNVVHCPANIVGDAIGLNIDRPAVAYAGVDNGVIVGCGGLAWGGGRCWVWFTMIEQSPRYAREIIRMSRKALDKAKQFGEHEVFVARDLQYKSSEKLIKLAGFSFYDIHDGKQIYRCVL